MYTIFKENTRNNFEILNTEKESEKLGGEFEEVVKN